MKKLLKGLGIALGAFILSFGMVRAFTSPYPVSYTNWAPGDTITSAFLNSLEQMIGTGSTSTSLTAQIKNITTGTSTKLAQISGQATTTGNLLVASGTTGWGVLAVGQNGYCPQANSSATYGISWAICGGSINGVTTSSYYFAASGPGLTVTTNGATTTVTQASSSYLQPSNNLSELTNTSTARSNLGYSAGTNLNLTSGGVFSVTGQIPVANGGTATSTAPTDGQYLGANGGTPTYKNFVAGAGISISTTTTSTVFANTVSGSVAGSDQQIQYNNNGAFGATSTFTFTSSTNQLNLLSPSSSIKIGNNFNDIPVATSVPFSESGSITSWTVPSGVTSVTISAVGASGGGSNSGAGGGGQGLATGTVPVTPGSVLYIDIGGQGASIQGINTGGGYNGGGNTGTSGGGGAGGGGGMTWVSSSSTFNQSASILIVAGGGGGAGGCSTGNGGSGGLLIGVSGTTASGAGGTGGTQFGGGTGGNTGSAGQGANGATSGGCGITPGGGGGYFGGGSGVGGASGAGGGGGGSSFFSSNFSGTTTASSSNGGNGTVTISYNIYSSDISSSTYSLAVGGHIITGGSTPTVSSCGASPSITGNDTAGIITTGSGTVTSCTLVYSQEWANPPVCTLADSLTSITPDISADNTTSTVFGFSATLTSGKIYYHCLGY